MKDKLFYLIWKNPTLLQKIGFVLGAAVGVISGLLISERADSYVVLDAEEEEDVDGES